MKKLTLLLVLCLAIFSCNNDDDEVTTLYLTEDDKEFIPFEESTSRSFENQDAQIVTADISMQPEEFAILRSDLGTFRLESKGISTYFQDRGETYTIYIFKERENGLRFNSYITLDGYDYEDYDFYQFYKPLPCDNYYGNIRDHLTDFSTDQFSYESVLVLDVCGGFGENPIDKIIYSPEKGIELILYSDGTYIKHVE